MSTKIYNGYYIENRSLMELYEFVMNLRKRMGDTLREIYYKMMADICTNLIDTAAIQKIEKDLLKQYGIKTDKDSPLYTAFTILMKNRSETKKTVRRNPDYNYECTLVFIPIRDKILCLLYTEQAEFKTVWENTDGIHEYSYWNNMDKPRDLTEKEWEKRRKDWDEGLGKIGVPALRGFTVECTDVNSCPVPLAEEIVKYIPTIEDRANRKSMQIIFNKKYKEIETKELKKTKTDPQFQITYQSLYFSSLEYLRSNEGSKAIDNMSKNILPKLKKSITPKDLNRPLNEFTGRCSNDKSYM